MNDWSKIGSHVSKVILFDSDGKLIIYLRDNKPTIPFPNTWDLLGGGVEANETPEQAAIRELSEEIGVSMRTLNKLSEYVVNGKWLFHIFWGSIEASTAELTLTEGQRLEGIDLSEKDKYFKGMLAQALDDYIQKDQG
jgi:8-oxo-dGTP diphosphatase